MKTGPTPEELARYRAKKLRLWKKQEGRCGWEPCGARLPRNVNHCDLAHLVGLGMGGDRYDEDDPRNHDDNCRLMHRPCHQTQERSRK